MGSKGTRTSSSKTDEPMPPAVIERFKQLPGPREKQEVHELPQWVKLALVKREVEDLSYKDAAEAFGRTEKTLQKYGQSPAAEKWLADLQDFLNDPLAMAKAILQASSLAVTLDRFVIYEQAKKSDLPLADKIAKDLQDRMGLGVKKSSEGAIQVKINLGGTSLEMPAIEAEYEVVGGDEEDEDA